MFEFETKHSLEMNTDLSRMEGKPNDKKLFI